MIHIDVLKKNGAKSQKSMANSQSFSSLLKNVPERIFKSQIISSEKSL